MTYQITIHRTPSKSGNRIMFFGKINGKRISKTNFSTKWEAVAQVKHIVATGNKAKLDAYLAA